MAIQTPMRGLRSFCLAAKCLSFKDAAKQLYLTPSAVSHQIKQLEDQLGISLFKRQTRAIELTHSGERFYQAVQPLLHNLDHTISNFTDAMPNKSISISLPEFFASELFVPNLHHWSEQHPDINLNLETVKSPKEQIKATDLSIVLVDKKPLKGKVDALFPVKYVAACNKELYATCYHQGFDALKSVPLILHQAKPWAWHKWAEQNDIKHFQPKKLIELDSMFSIARAAQQGMGVALIPMPISQSWFTEQSLIKLFDHELRTHDKYYLIQDEQSTPSAEQALFVDWIKNHFSSI